DDAIVLVPSPGAYDTRHELQAVAAEFVKQGWKSVLLVSSASHTRRVALIWESVAPTIPYRVVAAPSPGFDRWWNDGKHVRSVAYEIGALTKELGVRLRLWIQRNFG
ncbi:MAG: YdcF family protein, partial [Bdellovibrionales bacterium]|nr:YdcF family protein [Bdellovibrionales bacterium]